MRMVSYLKILISLLLVCNLCYGQTLVKNIDQEAKHLKHNLNINKDSLILESTKFITEVIFYNKLATTKYPVHKYKTSIALDNLTLGKNTIMVREGGNYIVFNIIIDAPINTVKKEIVRTSVEMKIDTPLITVKKEIVRKSFEIDTQINTVKSHILTTFGENDCPKGIKIIPYRLSNRNRLPKCVRIQSRADYRATHLTPGGRKYKKDK